MINIQFKTTETYQKVKKTSCLLRAQGLNLVGSGRVWSGSRSLTEDEPRQPDASDSVISVHHVFEKNSLIFSLSTSCPLPR